MSGFSMVDGKYWVDMLNHGFSMEEKLLASYVLAPVERHGSGIRNEPIGVISVYTGLTHDQVISGLRKLEEAGWIRYDFCKSVLWVRNYYRRMGGSTKTSPYLMTGVLKQLRSLNGSPLIFEFLDYYPALYDAMSERDSEYFKRKRKEIKKMGIPPQGGIDTTTLPLSLSLSTYVPDTGDVPGTGYVPSTPSGQESLSQSTVQKKTGVDASEVKDLWNHIVAPNQVPSIRDMTAKRKKQVRERSKLTALKDLDGWEIYFHAITKQPFLLGENDRGWTIDIDWALRSDENVMKVLEGKYLQSDRRYKNARSFQQELARRLKHDREGRTGHREQDRNVIPISARSNGPGNDPKVGRGTGARDILPMPGGPEDSDS